MRQSPRSPSAAAVMSAAAVPAAAAADPASDLLRCEVGGAKWKRAREGLEELELSAPMSRPTAEVYAKLLAVYLMEHELMLAKFLWKRIPEETKASEPALARLWEVGKALIKRDPAATYTGLAGQWPPHCNDFVQRLREVSRERYLRMVGDAYSSISVADLVKYTGSSTEAEALALADREKWGRDAQSGMVLPERRERLSAAQPSAEDKLKQLTDFICFLEK